MKKIGIITINDNNNYGNRLQNYALQEKLKEISKYDVITIRNSEYTNRKESIIKQFLRILKKIYVQIRRNIPKERIALFKEFNKNIKMTKRNFYWFLDKKIEKKYDYFMVGSDQVWNAPVARFSDVDLLTFAPPNKRISYAASFGVSELPDSFSVKGKENLSKFKAISVREDLGKNIVKNFTQRDDIEVLIDPTMLLNSEEWDKVSKKPYQLDMINGKKYILNYFLGNLSENRKKEIEQIAKENDCEIINILDKNSPFYETGPSEFLYLEKNAFLICTDSFHSCVFSILFDRPFLVFEREDKNVKMNSRIETLITKFELKNRKFEGKITRENLEHDYSEAYEILEKEREKANNFLKKALDIKE